MKIYLIMHKEAARSPGNTQAWVDVEKIRPNGVFVKSVRAFLRKRDAKNWLEEKGFDHLEIVTAETIT